MGVVWKNYEAVARLEDQIDLDSLQKWSDEKSINFNLGKCHISHTKAPNISTKAPNISQRDNLIGLFCQRLNVRSKTQISFPQLLIDQFWYLV